VGARSLSGLAVRRIIDLDNLHARSSGFNQFFT
jgi:hypothetical protein